MPRYKFPSIVDIDQHLDDSEGDHNGFDSRHFRLFVEKRVPVAVIARLMNVGSTETIKGWIKKLEQKDNAEE